MSDSTDELRDLDSPFEESMDQKGSQPRQHAPVSPLSFRFVSPSSSRTFTPSIDISSPIVGSDSSFKMQSLIEDNAGLEGRLSSVMKELFSVKKELEEEKQDRRQESLRSLSTPTTPMDMNDLSLRTDPDNDSSVQKIKLQHEEQIQILINKNQFQAAEIDELYDKIQNLQREKLMVQKNAEKSLIEKTNIINLLKRDIKQAQDEIHSLKQQSGQMINEFSVISSSNTQRMIDIEDKKTVTEAEKRILAQRIYEVEKELDQTLQAKNQLEQEFILYQAKSSQEVLKLQHALRKSKNDIIDVLNQSVFDGDLSSKKNSSVLNSLKEKVIELEDINSKLQQEITRIRLLKVSSDERLKIAEEEIKMANQSIAELAKESSDASELKSKRENELLREMEEKAKKFKEISLERESYIDSLKNRIASLEDINDASREQRHVLSETGARESFNQSIVIENLERDLRRTKSTVKKLQVELAAVSSDKTTLKRQLEKLNDTTYLQESVDIESVRKVQLLESRIDTLSYENKHLEDMIQLMQGDKDREVKNMDNELQNARQIIKSLQDELDRRVGDLHNSQIFEERFSNELPTLRSDITKLRVQIDEMTIERSNMKSAVEEERKQTNQSMNELQKQRVELTERCNVLTITNNKQKEELETRQKIIIQLQQDIHQKNEKYVTQELDERKRKEQTLKDVCQELEEQNKVLLEKYSEKLRENDQLKGEYDEWKKEHAESSAQFNELKESHWQSQIENYKQVVESALSKQKLDHDKQLASRDADIESLQQRLERFVQENENIKSDYKTMQSHFEKQLSHFMVSENVQTVELQTSVKKLLDKNLKLKLKIDTLERQNSFLEKNSEVKFTLLQEEHLHTMNLLKDESESNLRHVNRKVELQKAKFEEEKARMEREFKRSLKHVNNQLLEYLEKDSKQLENMKNDLEKNIRPAFSSAIDELNGIMIEISEVEFMGSAQLEEIRNEIEGISSELYNTKHRNGTISQDLEITRKKESELNLSIETLNRDIVSVRTKYDELQTRYLQETKVLQTDLILTRSEKEMQEKLNEQREQSIRETCETLKLDNSQLRIQIEKLKTVHEEDMRLERMNKIKPADTVRMEAEFEECKKSNAQYKKQIWDLQSRVKALKQQIREKDERNLSLTSEQRNMQRNVDDQVKLIEMAIEEQEQSFSLQLEQSFERNSLLEDEAKIRQDILRSMEVKIQDLEQQVLDLQSEQRTDRKKIANLTSKLKACQEQLVQA